MCVLSCPIVLVLGHALFYIVPKKQLSCNRKKYFSQKISRGRALRVGGAGDIGKLAAECKFCLKKINFNAIIAANNENGGSRFRIRKECRCE